MDRILYEKACKCNQTLKNLFDRLGLPCRNFYAFMHNVFTRPVELSANDDYLVLLAAIWGPSEHLFDSSNLQWGTCGSLSIDIYDLEELEPQIFEELCVVVDKIQGCSKNACNSSITALIRFPEYRNLLCHQKEQLAAYKEWSSLYEEHRQHMREETKQLTASDDYDPVPPELLLEVFQIFEEYVRNLCVEPKNRTKYKPIVTRVKNYISALSQEGETSVDSADDIIGTVFERLIINATRYAPLSKIGPAYLYWIFKNRLTKIGNPENANINLLLGTNTPEELFPLNEVWHSRCPSVADQAQVYVFDEICALWDKHCFGDTTLSRFLFEKATPFYADFLKRDTESSTKREVTHNFLKYNMFTYSNEFLSRAVHDIAKKLCIPPYCFTVDSIEPLITFDIIQEYFRVAKKDEVSCLIKLFSEGTLLASYCEEEKCVGDISIKDFIRAAYNKIAREDIYAKQFEEIFLLGEKVSDDGIYCEEWYLNAEHFILSLWHDMAYPQDSDESDRNTPCLLLFDIAILICTKQQCERYCKRIIQLSKKALFREYTQRQYDRLTEFVDDLIPSGDTCVVTPIHLPSEF